MSSSVRTPRPYRHRGVTLLEVVASIALAGSLLSVVIVGGSQHLRQLKSAHDKLIATEALDVFISTWSVSNFDETGIPDAVERSGLTASGRYGRIQRTSGPSETRRMRVLIQSQGRGQLGESTRIKLSVFINVANRQERSLAWAEVMVPSRSERH